MVVGQLSLQLRVVFRRARAVLMPLVAGSFLVAVAGATTLHDTGQWSGSSSNWGSLYGTSATHMAITRGEGTPYHSQIIWWSGSRNQFNGRELEWRPFTNDCSMWPDSNFIPVTVSWPGINAFCSGHTFLADGRMLIAGGNDFVFRSSCRGRRP